MERVTPATRLQTYETLHEPYAPSCPMAKFILHVGHASLGAVERLGGLAEETGSR